MYIKNLSTLLLFFLFSFSSSQTIEFLPNIKVTYGAKLKLGENFTKEQNFVLVGNDKDYYFAGAQNYLNDTKQYIATGIDFQSISDYFQERVIKKEDNLTTFYTFSEVHIRYQEKNQSKWVLYSDTKIINGIKCQMAAINKYGRRWIAYFSKEYTQSIGPYKFNGLPGLILELYDTKFNYQFKAFKIEKYNKRFQIDLSNYRNFYKENYLKAKYNLDYEGAGYPPMQGAMKKEYNEMMERKKKMENNPIELKPFE